MCKCAVSGATPTRAETEAHIFNLAGRSLRRLRRMHHWQRAASLSPSTGSGVTYQCDPSLSGDPAGHARETIQAAMQKHVKARDCAKRRGDGIGMLEENARLIALAKQLKTTRKRERMTKIVAVTPPLRHTGSEMGTHRTCDAV